jgi:uncharacterized protein
MSPRHGSVAVIGSGISGLTAAYLLQRRYDVTLFEADARLGGHAHTHQLITPDGQTIDVDSGFIVCNDVTYPLFTRLLAELRVDTTATEMGMSICCEGCGLVYAGGRGLAGLLARPQTSLRPRFARMLAEVARFQRHARHCLAADAGEQSLGDFLDAGGYSPYVQAHYVLPVVSAVWSAGAATAREYPARYLFRFLDNHGMLSVRPRLRWRTIPGGARRYVERLAKNLNAINTHAPVRSIARHADSVEVRDEADHGRRFDGVVVATHADTALGLLADPTPLEQSVLGAFAYSTNDTILHTDARLLPRQHAARVSWNYLLPACDANNHEVVISYYLNRLQGLHTNTDYLVSLNAGQRIDPASAITRMSYQHPIYTAASVAAQARLPHLNAGRTAFAGAYHGWGFHEDGCRAGVNAAAHFGVEW